MLHELNLNLTDAKAQIEGSRFALRSLHGQIDDLLAGRCPFATRLSKLEPDEGWYIVHLSAKEVVQPQLGIACGHVVDGLRHALNYVAMELVRACGAQCKHQQFPIFESEDEYRRKVGTAENARDGGYLGGIKNANALSLIESIQPYRAGMYARRNPLWLLWRFSNVNSHRKLAWAVPRINRPVELILMPRNPPVNVVLSPTPRLIDDQQEWEVARIWPRQPLPQGFRVGVGVDADVIFRAPPLAGESQAVDITPNQLTDIFNYVGQVVGSFEVL
jgi:hypothetical protein